MFVFWLNILMYDECKGFDSKINTLYGDMNSAQLSRSCKPFLASPVKGGHWASLVWLAYVLVAYKEKWTSGSCFQWSFSCSRLYEKSVSSTSRLWSLVFSHGAGQKATMARTVQPQTRHVRDVWDHLTEFSTFPFSFSGCGGMLEAEVAFFSWWLGRFSVWVN